VRRTLRSALERANAWQIGRIAIPPLGLGAGNLDLEASAELMAEEITRHTRESTFPIQVTIVAETRDEASLLELFMARSAA
jgi:O-acetyl-ADP-ribose deacetylase (regulator of RNase III)